MVIVFIFFMFLLSKIVLNNQIEKAAQGYLQNAFTIARNGMINRLNEMKKVSVKTSKSLEFQNILIKKNY